MFSHLLPDRLTWRALANPEIRTWLNKQQDRQDLVFVICSITTLDHAQLHQWPLTNVYWKLKQSGKHGRPPRETIKERQPVLKSRLVRDGKLNVNCWSGPRLLRQLRKKRNTQKGARFLNFSSSIEILYSKMISNKEIVCIYKYIISIIRTDRSEQVSFFVKTMWIISTETK